MNCACPPERWGGTTIRRAAAAATRDAELLAQHVQRGVEAGRRPRAGDDGPVLHVEDVLVDQGLAGTARASASTWRQWVVQRRPSSSPASPSTNAAVQCAKTSAPRSWAARTTSTTSGRGLEVVALGGDDHQVGVGRGLEAVLDVQVEAGGPLDPAGARGGDDEVEDRVVVLRVVGLAPTPRTSRRARTAPRRPGRGPRPSAPVPWRRCCHGTGSKSTKGGFPATRGRIATGA